MPVRLAERSYEIHVGLGLQSRLGELAKARLLGKQILVATDANVAPLYAEGAAKSLREQGYAVAIEVLPAGEESKTLKHASRLYDRLIAMNADRKATVIAVGGGVIGDMAGFAAATFARGIPFVQAPTSLLAMVDASVGGKVGIDHPGGKNMIGAFHQPALVICDICCIATLPEKEYIGGLAEIVKHGVILDAEMFAELERDADAILDRSPALLEPLVARNCQIKAGVVEKDEFETKGLRSALNYGHTFAHSFETATGYSRWNHGEAVSIGMECAALLAERMGRIDGELRQRQSALCRKFGLPVRLPKELLQQDLIGLMRRDKKASAGKLRFVLPTRLGAVDLVEGIDEKLVGEVLQQAAE